MLQQDARRGGVLNERLTSRKSQQAHSSAVDSSHKVPRQYELVKCVILSMEHFFFSENMTPVDTVPLYPTMDTT